MKKRNKEREKETESEVCKIWLFCKMLKYKCNNLLEIKGNLIFFNVYKSSTSLSDKSPPSSIRCASRIFRRIFLLPDGGWLGILRADLGDNGNGLTGVSSSGGCL